MSILNIRPIRHEQEEGNMDIFTMQEFMTYTKGITYLIMGGILIFMPFFWLFLTDRDDD